MTKRRVRVGRLESERLRIVSWKQMALTAVLRLAPSCFDLCSRVSCRARVGGLALFLRPSKPNGYTQRLLHPPWTHLTCRPLDSLSSKSISLTLAYFFLSLRTGLPIASPASSPRLASMRCLLQGCMCKFRLLAYWTRISLL